MRLLGHRQTKGAATDKPNLTLPRHFSTLPAEKALKKRVKRAVSDKDSGYAVLHEVRISGKRLRYLLEFFSPVLEGNRQAMIERLTSVQDELGKLNDIVTSEALLREYSPQLGDSPLLKDFLRYLEAQKKHRMEIALEILGMA